jgi:hypothetical protein
MPDLHDFRYNMVYLISITLVFRVFYLPLSADRFDIHLLQSFQDENFFIHALLIVECPV